MTFLNVLGVIAVSDMDTARPWYEGLFGRPADRVPMAEACEWQLTAAGWVQLVLSPDKAGYSMLTLNVDDVGRYAREVFDRGIPVGTIESGPMFALATVTDPDGNQVTLAQELRPQPD